MLGKIKGDLNIAAFKADYIHPFKQGAKIEAGNKTSYVKADNDLAFYDQSNGGSLFDSNQSNHFIYEENINAAYTSLSFEKKKTTIQLGLRAEQTVAKGRQLSNHNSF